MLFYLTTCWAGHLHIKGYLTVILIWTWWPVRTEQHIEVHRRKTILHVLTVKKDESTLSPSKHTVVKSSKQHMTAFVPTYHRRSY